MTTQKIINTISQLEFDEYVEIKTEEILFDQDVLKQCALNTCGMYGKNHGCPPKSGTEEDIKKRIVKYQNAFIINKIIKLVSWENILEATGPFNNIINQLRRELALDNVLILGAGPCTYCVKCCALNDRPCPFPDKIQYSIEGSGINIVQMSINRKMTYNAGNGNIAYFGLILFNNF